MLKKHKSIAPTHPGKVLSEIVLPELKVSKAELARSARISRQTLYDILNEKQGVTAVVAIKLSLALGSDAKYWLALQQKYDLETAERDNDFSDVKQVEYAYA